MKNISFLILLFFANVCRAMEHEGLTNAVDFVCENVLGSLHACTEAMSGAAERNGWTAADCADILSAAEQVLKTSSSPGSGYRRQNAISLLWEFGGTNSIPRLMSIMQNEEGLYKRLAGEGYFRVAASNPFPGWEAPLRAEIARSPVQAGSFAWSMYDFTEFELSHAGPAPGYQRNLVRFLLDQSTVECGERAMLDEILCREVPKWRGSQQRAENAERMIREHPEDASLTNFFANVFTDARAKGVANSAVRLNALNNGNASPLTNSVPNDPWADLLDDLPEKAPWEPPPGAPRPF